MFQDNPLLAQLKQQIHDSKEHVEGVVKSTDKAYGFLECDKKSYFIAPPAMKKVMHGDKIKATIEKQGDKEQAEPEELIEPMLTRFIAKVRFNKDKKLQVLVDHPSINQPIGAQQAKSVKEELQEGDWVVANLKTHPLRDDRFFYATINQFICRADDELAPWWVTLARHEQSRHPVQGAESYEMLDQQTREDLTALHFVTIDSESTQDMDDALYIEPIEQNGTQTGWRLVVAIADPTAYIALDSQIEKDAKQRCFTNYLPGFNIPMLPRELSDELCSLMANETRPALVCYIETDLAGNITAKPHFVSAYVQSKAKLVYNKISDYLEQVPDAWQPETPEIAQQIDWLHQFTKARIQWRKTHSLLFKEKPDYSFILGHFLASQLLPPGLPKVMYLLITPIEFLSNFIVRPVTLTLRLLCNMVSGHLLLAMTFFGTTSLLLHLQASSAASFLTGAAMIAVTLFEVFVAVLQAYIFTILSAVYIKLSIEAH